MQKRLEMELPNEVVSLVISKLKFPELKTALSVSKEWEMLGLEEIKERLKQCLFVNEYSQSYPLLWQSRGTKMFVDENWYDCPTEFLWRYTKRSSLTKPITLLLHECLTSINGCCVYLQLVCFAMEEWSMVVSCNVWTSPLVTPLPCKGFFKHLGDTLCRLWTNTFVALWVDESDRSCSSFKVIFTAFIYEKTLAFIFDSKKHKWSRISRPPEKGAFAVLSPVVKGDLCYALLGSGQEGLSLISFNFRTDKSFKMVAAFPCIGRECFPYYLGERWDRACSCLAEYEGQLMLVEKTCSKAGAKLIISIIELDALRLRILDQIAIPSDWHGCADVKAVGEKLYINVKVSGSPFLHLLEPFLSRMTNHPSKTCRIRLPYLDVVEMAWGQPFLLPHDLQNQVAPTRRSLILQVMGAARMASPMPFYIT